MAQRKFKPGDPVRNITPTSVYYDRIKDKIGIYQQAWDERYSLHNACDVRYRGVTDLYGRKNIAQSEEDLEPVERPKIERPKTGIVPFDCVVNGRLMRVRATWQTCGHKEAKEGSHYNRCLQCYPPSGKIKATHGPYYYGYYQDEQGQQKRVYIGRELPAQDEREEA